MWFLRDPWQLSDQQLLLPEPLALLAELCDGTSRPGRTLQAAFLAAAPAFLWNWMSCRDTLAATG